MTIDEIQKVCTGSSSAYLGWLTEKKKGESIVKARAIIPVDDSPDVFKVLLAGKLFNTESLLFRNERIVKEYDMETVKVEEYDQDKSILIVKANGKSRELFDPRHPEDLLVVSDLKFLVKRVEDWYEQNGMAVKIPTMVPTLNADGLSRIIGTPTKEQQRALDLVLSNPFSYVWGAPGTGKTRFVLANAILRYLDNGKRVCVLAPTNAALEQVLLGVMEMMDKVEIPREKILRLGIPSNRFAAKYPEVCEVRGIEKKIANAAKQIQTLKKVVEAFDKQKQIEQIAHAIGLEAELKSESDQLILLENEINNDVRETDRLKSKHKTLNDEHDRARRTRNEAFDRVNSAWQRFRKWLTGAPSKWQGHLDLSIQVMNKTMAAMQEVDEQIRHLEAAILEQRLEVGKRGLWGTLISEIQSLTSHDVIASKIVPKISVRNPTLPFRELEVRHAQLREDYNPAISIGAEYLGKSADEISQRIRELESELRELRSRGSEERVEKASIIGSTLDTYIHRFIGKDLEVDHFFLDEAGYANVVKALTLFRSDKPVSFLGDHMQLPPVSEIDDLLIQNDPNFKNLYVWSQSALFVEDLFEKKGEECWLRYLQHNSPDFILLKKVALSETHRFGKRLAKVLDNHVYKLGFSSIKVVEDTDIKSLHVSFRTPGQKKRENPDEALAIREWVESNLGPGDDFAILSPYSNQVNLIGMQLRWVRDDMRIMTVHKSQGKEWDTVILSVADREDKWFSDTLNPRTNGLKLMNTAVSRAKKQLIIVCDHGYWSKQNGQMIKSLLEVAMPISRS